MKTQYENIKVVILFCWLLSLTGCTTTSSGAQFRFDGIYKSTSGDRSLPEYIKVFRDGTIVHAFSPYDVDTYYKSTTLRDVKRNKRHVKGNLDLKDSGEFDVVLRSNRRERKIEGKLIDGQIIATVFEHDWYWEARFEFVKYKGNLSPSF